MYAESVVILPPRTRPQVDVWSAGVIFYSMLYGRKPYGEAMSQEQMLRERVMAVRREPEFPESPQVRVLAVPARVLACVGAAGRGSRWCEGSRRSPTRTRWVSSRIGAVRPPHFPPPPLAPPPSLTPR